MVTMTRAGLTEVIRSEPGSSHRDAAQLVDGMIDEYLEQHRDGVIALPPQKGQNPQRAVAARSLILIVVRFSPGLSRHGARYKTMR